VSLGYSIGKDRQGDIDFQRIMAAVDPNNSGYVHFDAFLDFMVSENNIKHLCIIQLICKYM
jgi:actinin alpha